MRGSRAQNPQMRERLDAVKAAAEAHRREAQESALEAHERLAQAQQAIPLQGAPPNGSEPG